MTFVTKSDTVLIDYILQLCFEENSKLTENKGLGSQFRLIFFESGSGEIIVENRTIAFNSPSVICLTESEQIKSLSGSNIIANTLYFQPAVINQNFLIDVINNPESEFSDTELADLFCIKSFSDYKYNRDIIHLSINNKLRIDEYTKRIIEITREPIQDYWPCMARSYFIELLNYIQRIILDTKQNVYNNDIEINNIISYLKSNYKEKITISKIATQFCTNRTTISNRFREITGYTIIEYLNKVRIDISLLLLRDTTIPINDIMLRVGFNDPAHFIRTFKSIVKMTPSNYRKEKSLF